MMSIKEFGKALIKTGDLDPVYIILYEAKLGKSELYHYLLAYLAFYHMGTASWTTEQSTKAEYWQRMGEAAASKDYPRSSERRHYRGKSAIESVNWLRDRGVKPLFGWFQKDRFYDIGEVTSYVETWKGFGKWAAFKTADILERLGIVQIDFGDGSDGSIYESPKEGAEDLWAIEMFPVEGANRVVPWAIEKVVEDLANCKAPPRYEKFVGTAEAETVLCKYHSYLRGKYHIGEDIEACYKALSKFKHIDVAKRLLKAGKGELW